MGLRFYNTLTRKKEDFRPLEEGKAGLYVCGITAYDICHIGHARSAIVFDIIYKYLKSRGYAVTFVKNFTDVDDKIIARSNEEGVDIHEIAERYIREHNEDMDMLSVARPTVAPKATENIKGMIRLVEQLLEKDLAYVVNGDVYFSVDAFKGYGKLSRRNLDDMMAGARVGVDEKKKNPLDFVLWKSSKEGEPWWDSPWGRGRPGWHIECSVMSQRYLGETFDIHGGGEDLIFPHHENEIAQSEGASGKPFARYWIHNGFIRVNNEKMSKSLGNFFTIKDILKLYHPETLRLFVLQSHYRSYIDFSDESLAEARAGMNRFYETLLRVKQLLGGEMDFSAITEKDLEGAEREVYAKVEALDGRFVEAMDDDFNTARAIGYMFDVIRLINGYLDEKKFRPTPASLFVLDKTRSTMHELGKVLGLLLEDPDEYFEKDRTRELLKRGLDREKIESLIRERVEARAARDWQKADEIRATLSEQGIILKDTPTETTWNIQ
ncbi:MAG: cysteine--tRNA ligase [Deltaproteobacteria bacterium]|nr:cysteine--tRNA ligase [Deltaproteobacteria bacterium]